MVSSPITAAGPPRICTVFRDTEKLNDHINEKAISLFQSCQDAIGFMPLGIKYPGDQISRYSCV